MEVAKLAIERITSVDRETGIDILNTEDVEEAIDNTWIVSGQSRDQRKIIQGLDKSKAIYVEGAFRVWIGSSQVRIVFLLW